MLPFSPPLISFLFLMAWIVDDDSLFRVHSLPASWDFSSFSLPDQSRQEVGQCRAAQVHHSLDIYKDQLTH